MKRPSSIPRAHRSKGTIGVLGCMGPHGNAEHMYTPSLRSLFAFPPVFKGRQSVDLRALTHGLPPVAVAENLRLFYEEWRVSGVDAWNNMTQSAHIFLMGDELSDERDRPIGWWTLPEVVGDRFISRLLHAKKGTCIMMPNATQIVFSLLSCAELKKS